MKHSARYLFFVYVDFDLKSQLLTGLQKIHYLAVNGIPLRLGAVEVDILERAMQKRAHFDLLDRGIKSQSRKIPTLVEKGFRYFFHLGGNHHSRQRRAAYERALADLLERFGERNTAKLLAVAEGGRADAYHALGDDDLGDGGIFERRRADALDSLLKYDLCELRAVIERASKLLDIRANNHRRRLFASDIKLGIGVKQTAIHSHSDIGFKVGGVHPFDRAFNEAAPRLLDG